MQKKTIFLSFVTFSALFFCLTACSHGGGGTSSSSSSQAKTSSKTSASSQAASSAASSTGKDKQMGYQLEKPADGEEIAVFETSMGTVKMRLFPEAAPKAVENFKGLINEGYYTGLIFHRVIDNFMVQTGDPNGDGTGGQSIWGKSFEDEFSLNLLNLRGAVAMANSGKNTNGSQFFINQAPVSALPGWDNCEKYYEAYKGKPRSFYGAIRLRVPRHEQSHKGV